MKTPGTGWETDSGHSAGTLAHLMAWVQLPGIRVKILGLAVAVALTMGVGAILVAREALLAAARAELDQHAVAVATNLAANSVDLVLTHSSFSLYQTLTSLQEGDADVRYAFVVDGKGQVLAHTFGSGFPTDLLQLGPPAPDQPPVAKLVKTEEGLIHDVAVPLLGGNFGYVRVGLSEDRLQTAARGLISGLVYAVMAVAGLAVLAALGMTEVMTRPLGPLIALTRAVARGELNRRVAPGPLDEFGRLTAAFNGMIDALEATHRELRAKEQAREELLDRVITAQEDERRRISRELHDEAGQALTGLMVGLRALMDEHREVRPRAEALRALAYSTLEGLRRLSLELRPQVLDDLGLVAAVRRYISDYSAQHGLAVELQVLGDESLRVPPRVETCFYRIIQEALTNTARHARARRVSVVLDLQPGLATAVVEDDGAGFVPAEYLGAVRPDGSGLGLFGMQERAMLTGGSLQIESSPGQGTSVFLKCPIAGEVSVGATAPHSGCR